MTDEHEHAMKVWREACGESQEAFYRIGEQPNDPESIKQGQLADQAAAAVIAADRAGLVAEVERLREALVQHNDRLRSAAQVAARDGQDTNWKTFRGQITYTLAEYHDLVIAARAALGASHDADA